MLDTTNIEQRKENRLCSSLLLLCLGLLLASVSRLQGCHASLAHVGITHVESLQILGVDDC